MIIVITQFGKYYFFVCIITTCLNVNAGEQRKEDICATLSELDLQRARRRAASIEQAIKMKIQEADEGLVARAKDDHDIPVKEMNLDQIIAALHARDECARCLVEEYEKYKRSLKV